MDFGDVSATEGLELTLPPDDAITASALSRAEVGHARVRVGLPIWNKREWIGEIYPHGTKALLETYSHLYDTVEVNSTFYAPPAPAVIAGWAASTPPDFRFCPKVWRQISHEPNAKQADVDRWLECVLAFGDRLGPSFLQLPPQTGLESKRALARLLDMLSPHLRLTLELRHPAWMSDRETRRRLFQHLASRGIGLVITDTVGRRDLVHMGVSAPFSLVRFKGHGLGERDEARVEAWGDRLGAWSRAGLAEAYFIAHERTDHERLGAPLLRRLGAKLASQGIAMGRTLEPPSPAPQLGLI